MPSSILKPAMAPSRISMQPVSEESRASSHLIFFVTGNPGLISYYDIFLGTLHQLLSDASTQLGSDTFHIYGQSLAGFEENDQLPENTSTPYNLEDQISITLQALQAQRIPSGLRKGREYDSIILMGHSVGTYILLEVLTRLRKSASSLNIKAGILLFPTVTHLAHSPSGIKFSGLFRIPGFPRAASVAVKALIWPIPRPALKQLVRLITGMPEDSTEVTTRFLTSSMGVWQALHLAKDEMESITEDKWDEDIWGIEHADAESKTDTTKLIFYFGENDHWVANHSRDALIASRGKGDVSSSKPIMLIDENGVDHGFCIRHSEIVAEKVKLWIDQILEG